MSARVLLMNSKKSLLSGSLSLSKRHNHQTMNRSPQHCHQATIHPKLRKKSCPGDEVRSCRAWRWGQRLMFLPSLCSAYLLLLTLLSSTLHSIFNTALLLFLLTDTSDPFHFLPDLPPTLLGQSLMIIFPQVGMVMVGNLIMYHLEQANKNPLLNKNDLSILHRLGQVGACEH